MRGLVAALLLVAAVAEAAPDVTRKAREAFQEGTALFNLGKFDKAIEKWEEGYQAKPDPIFLYNIAQAYRLIGENEKALFFYRNYLRNSPSAPNREEVEDKMQKLEAAIEAQKRTREIPPDEALPLTGRKPLPSAPPKAQTPAPAEPPRPLPVIRRTPAPPAPATVTATVTRAPRYSADLAVAGGLHVWALGLPGGVDPAFGFTVGGGYDALVRGRLSLRIGVKLGYSFVSDVASTVSLVSLLAEPMVRLSLWRDRLYGFVAVGFGGLFLDGLTRGSAFLETRASPSGVLAAFELRPSLGLEYRVVPRVAIFVAPELVYSPAPDPAFLEGTLLRFAVSLGAAVRL
jgi:hypothetical protein